MHLCLLMNVAQLRRHCRLERILAAAAGLNAWTNFNSPGIYQLGLVPLPGETAAPFNSAGACFCAAQDALHLTICCWRRVWDERIDFLQGAASGWTSV